jgi:hypothetical protein
LCWSFLAAEGGGVVRAADYQRILPLRKVSGQFQFIIVDGLEA